MTLRAALAAVPVFLVAPGLALGAPLPTPTVQAPAEATAFEDLDPLESFGEEISVEVVGLQVWVTDRQGRPVTGLDRDDFVLLQDGDPVEIVNFAVFEDSADGTPPSRIEDEALLEIEASPLGGDGTDPVHLAILLDNWNMRPHDRARVFEDLRAFLEERVKPEDRVALLVHDRSLQLVQRFTDDGEELSQALDRIERLAPTATSLASDKRQAIEGIENAFMVYFDEGQSSPELACQLGAGWGSMENAARAYATAVQAHTRVSAAATASAADVLSGLPGHRVLLYVGAGMPQTAGIEVFQLLSEVCPSRQSELSFFQNDFDLTWLFQEVARRANAAGVTLFALEAESPAMDLGLDQRHSPGGASTSGTGGRRAYGPSFRPSVHAQRMRSLDAEGSLVLLARETGGRAFLNAADFAGDFELLARELRNYYSLGFHPPDPGDGELHRLEVRLTGDQPYRVRHRRAYRDKPPEQRMAERVLGVAQFGGGPNPLAVRLEIGKSLPVDGSYRVPVRLWVPLSMLTLVPGEEEGTLVGRLQVLMTATGAEGELGPVRQKLVPVSLRAGEEGVAGDQLVEIDVDLGPGLHHVAVAVRDGLGGETSYIGQEFRVPGTAVAATGR